MDGRGNGEDVITSNLHGLDSRSNLNGTKELVEFLASDSNRTTINNPVLTSPQQLGSGAISQTEVIICPNGLHSLGVGHANTGVTTQSLPIRSALDTKFRESLVNDTSDTVNLVDGVARRDCEPKTFLATSNRGVVDGLNIHTMLGKQGIGSSLCESGITNEDGDDVRGTGDDRDIHGFEAGLEFTNVHLLQLTITLVLALVGDTSTSTCDVDWRKRSGEDEARSV